MENGSSEKRHYVTSFLSVLALTVSALAFLTTYEQSHVANRAYYAVVEPTLDTDSLTNRRLFGTYIETNLGNTPAYDVTANKQLRILSKDSLPDIGSLPTRSNPIVVGSHVQMPPFAIWSDSVLTNQDIEALRSGKRRIYLFGKITYTDIFNRSQWTTFCYEYVFRWKKFFAYPRYNDASREDTWATFIQNRFLLVIILFLLVLNLWILFRRKDLVPNKWPIWLIIALLISLNIWMWFKLQ